MEKWGATGPALALSTQGPRQGVLWSARPAGPLTPTFISHPRTALATGFSPACLMAPWESGARDTGANVGSAHLGQSAAVLGATDECLGWGGLGWAGLGSAGSQEAGSCPLQQNH